MSARILVVEDDARIAVSVVKGLESEGFEVSHASDGAGAVERVMSWSPDLVVLDLMLPEVDGFEVLRRCRDRTSVPFLVLTARTELDTRLQVFELGAVDFLSKPFWLEELVARIRVRVGAVTAAREVLELGPLSIDVAGRRVHAQGSEVSLTPHEFNILMFLVRRPGRALTRAQIASGALSILGDVSDRTVDSHVARIRKKLGAPAASCVQTVWGIGYRFEEVGS